MTQRWTQTWTGYCPPDRTPKRMRCKWSPYEEANQVISLPRLHLLRRRPRDGNCEKVRITVTVESLTAQGGQDDK